MSDHHAPRYEDSGLPQPYHLVAPSPWPMVSSFAAGLLALGMVLYMHKVKWGPIDFGAKGTLIGLFAVLLVMFLWWRDVVRESVRDKAHSPIVKIGLRYGMALFIASEVMFFVAFFWAYYDFALFPREAFGGVWPPKGIQTFEPFHLPFMMTLILLLSGNTVTWAHHAMLEGKMKDAATALALSVGLGVLFSGFQIYEYSHAAFGIKDGPYGSTFYLATGFHGLHVIIGTIFLAVCWFRTRQGHFTPESHFGFEAAAWYWHFVDVVWLFLFISIYWFGAGG
jgi:cytochrome c oxidase subunit III